MEQSTAIFPNITRSLDKLNILVFWQILKENNPYLLDGDYMPEKDYTEEEKQYVQQAWTIMYDSYFQLKKDGKSKQVLNTATDLMLLMHKINQLGEVSKGLTMLEEHKHILPQTDYLTHQQGYFRSYVNVEETLNINFLEGSLYNMEIANKRITALTNKYNRLKKENNTEVSEQVDNVFSVIAKVAARLKFHLSARDLSVTEWLAYEQEARDQSKAEEELSRQRKKK